MKINNYWKAQYGIQYKIDFNNLKDKILRISISNAEKLFRSLLSEEELKNIWKAKRLVCAEYSKVLVDAFFEEILDENVLAISIALIEYNSSLDVKKFATQRLVGKKRKDLIFELKEEIHVVFRSEDYDVVEWMLSNKEDSILNFLEENRNKVSSIKSLLRE